MCHVVVWCQCSGWEAVLLPPAWLLSQGQCNSCSSCSDGAWLWWNNGTGCPEWLWSLSSLDIFKIHLLAEHLALGGPVWARLGPDGPRVPASLRLCVILPLLPLNRNEASPPWVLRRRKGRCCVYWLWLFYCNQWSQTTVESLEWQSASVWF